MIYDAGTIRIASAAVGVLVACGVLQAQMNLTRLMGELPDGTALDPTGRPCAPGRARGRSSADRRAW